ncbi:hypothetical protein [Sphingomicrobium aestuariivivum]|uniref:hypothetical protein n=1 Tax=Sphingomicrobium aestuariivivum TaxID=1582356 RepID=UPI001FD7223D|nr:hypothetical protein [Sphingomicrobium aestuariivivum]MCJ8190214.1 hypothetical protein [Sphingomicrobium aestuariivivum]
MRRLILATLALPLAACGGSEEAAVVEEQADAPEVVAIEGRDITAIDAATDNDAGLVDDEVPGRNAGADEADED